MSEPKGPYRLVTVNTAPERAKRLIGRMTEALKDRYDIRHVDNCESESTWNSAPSNLLLTTRETAIDEVLPKVTKHKPDVLVRRDMICSSVCGC